MADLIKCPWCKFIGNSESIEEHFRNEHFLTYQEASEIAILQKPTEEGICYKCGSPKSPLTFLIPDYYIPCWDCLTIKERGAMRKNLLEEIEEFYNKILSDRYLQLFLIDPIYYSATISHTYDTFKSVLGKLKLPSRNNIWFLDWMIGTPKTIAKDNIEGIEIKDLGKLYKIESTKTIIKVNRYTVESPQIVKYDSIHHGRYNILNFKGDRKTKRLRIPGTDNCFKFWNNLGDFESWKSILKVLDEKGEEVNITDLSPLDFLTIKLCILRNKNFMRPIFQIIKNILSQGVSVFKDNVFLKNTINFTSSKDTKKFNVNLKWFPEKIEEKENNINISIL